WSRFPDESGPFPPHRTLRAKGQIGAHTNRRDQTRGVRSADSAFPRTVECRSMVDRAAHEGKSQRDVRRAADPPALRGNQTLVMIHGDDDPEVTPIAVLREKRIGGIRALRANPLRHRTLDRGTNHTGLFVPKKPVLASVRIEPEHRDRATRA